MHELLTNAVKHGALSSPSGEVTVSWTLTDNGQDDVLKFYWQERGGPVIAGPQGSGMGMSLLKTMFAGTHLNYASAGFSCEIDLRLKAAECSVP